MKLRPLATVFLFSPPTAANCSRRHRRTLSPTAKTLSPTTKNQPQRAGLLYLRLSITRLTALFLPQARLSLSPRALNLFIQTPSSR
jgi:hypothetical protein